MPRRRTIISTARPARVRDAAAASEDYGAGADPDWRTIDWPAHVHRTELVDRCINYVDLGEGDGPPVVFVHGLGGSWQNWLEQLPAVARHRRVVALDLPGFGGSELPDAPISITGYADTVEALCDHLDLGPVVVVGNSMGGFISADLAIRHPDRVTRMVLIDAAGISTSDLRRQPLRTLARVLAGVAPTPGVTSPALRRPLTLQLAWGAIARHPTRLARDLLAEQSAGGAGAPAYELALEALLDYDFRDRLPEIGCPTLVVHGTNDMLVPVGDAHEFARLVTDARLVILEDTGHVPMLERPRVFNHHLLEFLAEAPGDRAAPPGDVVREAATG